MKRCKEILIAAVFAMIAFPATAILPRTELQPFWMRVFDVERTDSATRGSVRFQSIPKCPLRITYINYALQT